MKMKMPDVLIAGWPVVLAGGDAFTPENIPHGVRQVTRSPKEVVAKIVRDVQYVLIVASRDHQAVAFYSGVVVRRNESKHVGIYKDDGCFWSRRRQRLRNSAERTLVPGWSVLHKAYRRSGFSYRDRTHHLRRAVVRGKSRFFGY